jgi:uncharacterized protein (DUF488 family)
MTEKILTIGHSNHPLERFLALLEQHGIELLADIRRFPGSRKHPHFSRAALESTLPAAGIECRWFEVLGGRRPKTTDDSPNLGLENESFRNYADYMMTVAFQDGVTDLRELARCKRTVLMCAEGLYWQCHRRLVSDYLMANGVTVEHIMPNGEVRPHMPTRGVSIEEGEVTYTGERTLFT